MDIEQSGEYYYCPLAEFRPIWPSSEGQCKHVELLRVSFLRPTEQLSTEDEQILPREYDGRNAEGQTCCQLEKRPRLESSIFSSIVACIQEASEEGYFLRG